MAFTSFSFLLFAAAVIALYYLVPKKYQWWVLLIASYAFYFTAGAKYLIFIVLTTVTTYFTARHMGKALDVQDAYLAEHKKELSREEKKEYKARVKSANRKWMIGCLLFNFGMLSICKAALVEPFRAMMSGTGLSFLSLGLPMGISFYMFQSMGYVVDVQRGTCKAEKNFFRLALFVSFFPQLVQGPISKFTQLAPTLYAPKDFDGKTVSFGLQRMLWGYFKKLVVADRIAVAIGTLKGAEYTGVGFLLLSLFYAVQIYGDFTGGIDVTIGLAETMGVRLPENFIRPYFSKNIAEYWRRWHISLGVWMKDYIFYPISVSGPMRDLSKWGRAKLGSFGKRLPVYVASIATWFVTGIWHGLNLNFVVWGMLNCFFVVLSEECVPLYEKFHARFPGLKQTRGYGIFEMLRMFWLMNLIRACDLFPDVGEYFRRVGSVFTTFNWHILWDGTMMKLGLSGLDYAVLGCSIAVLFYVSVFQEKHGSFRKALAEKPALLRYGLIFAMFLVVILMGSYGIGYDASNFIYNQF